MEIVDLPAACYYRGTYRLLSLPSPWWHFRSTHTETCWFLIKEHLIFTLLSISDPTNRFFFPPRFYLRPYLGLLIITETHTHRYVCCVIQKYEPLSFHFIFCNNSCLFLFPSTFSSSSFCSSYQSSKRVDQRVWYLRMGRISSYLFPW